MQPGDQVAERTNILERYLAQTPQSGRLAARARHSLPSGIVTDTRHFEPYGIYVDRAEGAYKSDVDGNRYLDFFGGHGANILGHAHPAIVQAVQHAVALGVQFAANQPLEIELAELVRTMVPTARKLRFTGSGTEATLLAIRLARVWTGRDKIVRFESHYHGWHDHAASGYAGEWNGSAAPGILAAVAENTILLPAGDPVALAAAIERHGAEIAGIIIEPVGSHFGVVPLAAGFLKEVQQAANGCGALFILDEVLSGFRVSAGGAQAVYDLEPDLTTLAKALCGGMPGGAVAGRADVLALLDHDPAVRSGRPKILHQGTFTGNPVSMAAGLAMLPIIRDTDACARINALGQLARQGLNDMFVAEDLPLLAYGDFSIFHILIQEDGTSRQEMLGPQPRDAYLHRRQPQLNRLRMALNLLKIDVNTKCSGLFSTAHREEHVGQLVSAMAEACAMLRAEGLLPPRSSAEPRSSFV
jgi:glutamate-1-semialdehyde 2,1-aminomutase